jgi:putative colanic acid biosynthesis glycosyltransferase
MITINVITIVRNDSVGLRRTWESLSSQTLAPNKWIIIDGASTDNTSEVIGEIGGSAFVVSEPDDGIYDAMNKGLSASRKFKSDYVVFMNAGDEFYEQSTLDLVSKSLSLLNPAPDLFYGDCVWAGTGVQHLKKARSHRFIYYGMFASHQSMYFKSTSISYLS